MKFKQGLFTPKNPQKYSGDYTNIVYRSSWEKKAFNMCDINPNIVKWASEEFHIPYICPTDGRRHRYFPDLYLKLKNGKKLIIEIKPLRECKPPRKNKNKQRYITECMTYAKNQAKWKYASEFAKKRGMEFKVWNEQTLKQMGLKL